jgi:WD40 repeat protein
MANKDGIVKPWRARRIAKGIGARQFEYHPTVEDIMVIGDTDGGVCILDYKKDEIVSGRMFGDTNEPGDTILGIALSKKNKQLFVTGSQKGVLNVHEWERGRKLKSKKVCHFEELTSIHLNSTESTLLCSGYQRCVNLYDLETGKTTRTYEGIHNEHINISRFTNHSPNLFATCSFDKYVKTWDTRVPTSHGPLYECVSNRGNVMCCFSPDDMYLLVSATDNEVKQYLTVDGRLQSKLDIPPLNRDDNYTRSYYMNDGDIVISGSSEQDTIHVNCAHTGAALHTGRLYKGRCEGSLYVQSLRGATFDPCSFSVLVNYKSTFFDLEIVSVNMLEAADDSGMVNGTAAAAPQTRDISAFAQSLRSEQVIHDFDPANSTTPYGKLSNSKADDNEEMGVTDGTGPQGDDMNYSEVLLNVVDCDEDGFEKSSVVVANGPILLSRSPYFRRMMVRMKSEGLFDCDGEQGPKKRMKITLSSKETNITASTMRIAWEYMWSDRLARLVEENNLDFERTLSHISALFDTATLLELPRLFSLVEEKCTDSYYLNFATVGQIMEIARTHRAHQLLKHCAHFFSHHCLGIKRYYSKLFAVDTRVGQPQSDWGGNSQGGFSSLVPEKDLLSDGKVPAPSTSVAAPAVPPAVQHREAQGLARMHVGIHPTTAIMIKNIVEQVVTSIAPARATYPQDTSWECSAQIRLRLKEKLSFVSMLESNSTTAGTVDTQAVERSLERKRKASPSKDNGEQKANAPGCTPTLENRPGDVALGVTRKSAFQEQCTAREKYSSGLGQQDGTEAAPEPLVCDFVPALHCCGMYELENGDVMALNGYTQRNYFSYSPIPVYSPKSKLWRYARTYGDIPDSTETQSNFSCWIDGGSRRHLCLLTSSFKVFVLDTWSMSWASREASERLDVPARTRFSLNSLSTITGTGIASDGDKGSRSDDGAPSADSAGRNKNALKDQFMVVFGGLEKVRANGRGHGQCFNEVHIIKMSPVVAHDNGRPCPEKKGQLLPPSVAHQCNHAVTYNASLLPALVRGRHAPSARVGHTATVLYGESCRTKCLVVSGGIGYVDAGSSLYALDVSNLEDSGKGQRGQAGSLQAEVTWVGVQQGGEDLRKRDEHCATALDESRMVIWGGRMSNRDDADSVYLVKFNGIELTMAESKASFTISKVIATNRSPPVRRLEARVSAAMIYSSKADAVLLYGGAKVSDNEDGAVVSFLEHLQLNTGDNTYTLVKPECVFEDYGNCPEIVIPVSRYETDMQMLAQNVRANNASVSNPFTDVTFEIVTEETESSAEGSGKIFVRAHKSLLAQRSDRFKALFYGGMSEASMGSSPIAIYGTNEKTFRALLEYLYSDSINVVSRNDHYLIMELLVLGNEYMLNRLVRLCEGILLRLLEIENSAEFLDFADRYGMSITGETLEMENASKSSSVYCGSILREGCISYMLRHFSEVVKTEGYTELPKNLKEDLADRFKESVYSSNMVAPDENGVMTLMNRADQ